MFTKARRQHCFFGKATYIDTEVMFGRMHGKGILIEGSGNAYFGNAVAGEFAGAGKMYFSDGNTYTGNWADSLPNGQGKMVYAKTGNIYEGGFKNGKRHGKGTMYYEVADEDLETCRICYENEIDALFYRCGHVVACVDCARQVEDCPVCRTPVGAVVKMWKA